MKKRHKEALGNFASFMGVPVPERYHPTIRIRPIKTKKFPFIKVKLERFE